MWSILTVFTALSSASASPIQNTPLLRRDDCDANADNDLSCVVYRFSAPFNDNTFQGQAEFVANLTTYTFNEDTRLGEFTDPQIIRLGLGDDQTVTRCGENDCDADDYFSFEVCEKKNGTEQSRANSAQVIYGHITYPNSDNNDAKQCVSAVAATSDEVDNDNGTTGLNGSSLALRDCVYDLDSSIDQGQYWRMLLTYDYPVVYLVTASNETYSPDPALVNDGVPLTLSDGADLSLGSLYTWFSFQTPTPNSS